MKFFAATALFGLAAANNVHWTALNGAQSHGLVGVNKFASYAPVQYVHAQPAHVQYVHAQPAVQYVQVARVAHVAHAQQAQAHGPVYAAVHSQRNVQFVDGPSAAPAAAQSIVIPPSTQPLDFEFQSQSSPMNVRQTHIPGRAAETQESHHEEPADVLKQNIVKPIVHEIHEAIQPIRRISQEVRAVQETVNQVVTRGQAQTQAVAAPVAHAVQAVHVQAAPVAHAIQYHAAPVQAVHAYQVARPIKLVHAQIQARPIYIQSVQNAGHVTSAHAAAEVEEN